jgi:hypothetical protein
MQRSTRKTYEKPTLVRQVALPLVVGGSPGAL